MSDHATVVTERLILSAADPDADVDALYPIFADPDGWWYDPTGRHPDVARTRDWLRRAQRRWPLDGLSYWTVRLRDADATVIGVGGAQRHVSGSWNLNYRIAAAHQRRGYATELGRAAQAASAATDPGVAFIAWIAAHNTPSRVVAERLALVDQGPRIDGQDGAVRHAYADRTLDDAEFPPA